MKRLLLTATAALMGATAPASADVTTAETAAYALTAEQTEQCVTMMSGFPDDSPDSRYVFFRLGQELAKDVTPELSALMVAHMAENEATRLPADWPMIDVVEDIADPVLRQAAPAQTVAGMAHIAYFDALCGTFVQGQVDSLAAFNPELAEADLFIREDALYLRQILAEALDRLGGGAEAEAYATSLVVERDDIEFTGFVDEIGDLEALYMGDLDTKLATSNDLVNEGVNGETYQDSIALYESLNNSAKTQLRQDRLRSLCAIMPNCRTF